MFQPAVLILLGVIAVLLFWVGHVLARRRHVTPKLKVGGNPNGMQPLIEGAETVNKIARAEQMALAVVAERSGDAVTWLAHNIVSIVGAWRKNEAGTFEPTKDDSDVQPLYTRSGDLERYLDWARTVM
jgi:hypothetical protein